MRTATLHPRPFLPSPRSVGAAHRLSSNRKSQIANRKSAFTIIELMISIAMVVILMVGVHQVFKMSSDTVGIGQALADLARSNRSVQNIFHDDYQRLVKDAPLFIIRSGVSSTVGAFNTEAERAADRDGDPLTQDLDGNGQEGQPAVNGELTPLSIYNNRNHRVDVIGFPARGLFHRHTANDGSYSSPITSQDAFIFYEHVNLPTGAGGTITYYAPGEPIAANTANSLASQWVLGRVALLMRDPPMMLNGNPAPDNFILRQFPPTNPPNLSPLRWDSFATGPNPVRTLLNSRYDLLGASLETLRQDVADNRSFSGANADGTASTWWQPLVYRLNNPVANPVPINIPLARFECNPRISKPVTSESMAKAMPVLLNNCSQFIVEFAGDFVKQDNIQFDNAGKLNPGWGEVIGDEPDGVIDYVVDHSSVTSSNYNVAARVRWYGLPRDTNGDRKIMGFSRTPGYTRALRDDKGTPYSGPTNGNELIDVVPLDDVLHTLLGGYNLAAFERELPLSTDVGAYSTRGDYASMKHPDANTESHFRYTCIWVNSAPTMIRFVVKLEDPAGRLPDGQWYEYVVGTP
jgi:type II secretory pathway pseudopilin PulG